MALSPTLETDRRAIHKISSRREHAKEEQSRFPDGRGGRRVHGTDGSSCFLFFETVQDGRLFEKAALFARRCQFHLPQQRNRAVLTPNFPQRVNIKT